MEPIAGVGKEEVVGERESVEESVVLQCSSGGEVEDGEEVVRGGELQCGVAFPARRVVFGGEEEEGDVGSESDDVSHGGRIDQVVNDSGYWSSHGRTRRCRGTKRLGEISVVDRASIKRKLEVHECSPGSESVLYKDTDSDDSASSSDSDEASDSEDEYWSRRATRHKRRRDGEVIYGSILVTDESLHLRSSSQCQETVNCDRELKEMQQLLELQLQASERREEGMKLQMETMMEMMSEHMGHVEKRVCNLELGIQPQDQIMKRINLKLEKVMEGFTTLNENLSILSACLSKSFQDTNSQ